MLEHHQVSKAAEYLDKHNPGWYYSVNPDTLNLQSCGKCILGQIYGIDKNNNEQWVKIMDNIFNFEWSGLGFNQSVFASNELFKHHWITEINNRLASSIEKEKCLILQTK